MLLAALAVGLLFLLPGGPLHAQEGDDTIKYREKETGAVATYTADDPEGTTITWTLEGIDASDFRISPAGVLTFMETPNFEASTGGGANGTSPTYSVTVKATDSSGADDTEDVTVEVTNVDEDGTLTLLNRQPVDGVELDHRAYRH